MRLKRHAEQLTLWPEESPANPPRWQGDGEDLLTSGGSGPNSSALCGRLAPAGSWQRTLSESLLSSLTGLTGCATSLRLRATKSGRSLLVPATLEHPTDETASGSWPTAEAADGSRGSLGHMRGNPTLLGAAAMWPSATATAYGNNRSGAAGRVGPVRPSLEGAARLWSTTTSEDSRASGAAGYSTESGRHPGTTLTDAANSLVGDPEPDRLQGQRTGRHIGSQTRDDARREATRTTRARWPARPRQPQHEWEPSRLASPCVGRDADGAADWVAGSVPSAHRREALKALGNAVVPAVVEVIGRAIMECSRPNL